jgi:hypothetical protein
MILMINMIISDEKSPKGLIFITEDRDLRNTATKTIDNGQWTMDNYSFANHSTGMSSTDMSSRRDFRMLAANTLSANNCRTGTPKALTDSHPSPAPSPQGRGTDAEVIDDNESVPRKNDTTATITTENAPLPCGEGLRERCRTRDNQHQTNSPERATSIAQWQRPVNHVNASTSIAQWQRPVNTSTSNHFQFSIFNFQLK